MNKKSVLIAGLAFSLISVGILSTGHVKASQSKQGIAVAHTVLSKPFNYQTIQSKMLNAVDNYNNVQGTYTYVDHSVNSDVTVDFEIQEGTSPGSYSKVTNNKTGVVIEQRSTADQSMNLNFATKEFVSGKKFKDPNFAVHDQQIKNNPRQFKNAKGEDVYVYRQDPSNAQAALAVTNPQEVAFWLDDQTQVVGNELYLDRNATVLQGKLDPYLAFKLQGSDYKMWVDAQTGMLLRLIITDENNKVVSEQEVTALQIDKGVDHNKFAIMVPAGWNDKSPKQEKLQK